MIPPRPVDWSSHLSTILDTQATFNLVPGDLKFPLWPLRVFVLIYTHTFKNSKNEPERKTETERKREKGREEGERHKGLNRHFCKSERNGSGNGGQAWKESLWTSLAGACK